MSWSSDGKKDKDRYKNDNKGNGECCEEFWLKDPSVLVCGAIFVPCSEMTLEQRLNAITRIILIIFIILLIMRNKHALTFLVIALLIIVFCYYAQKRKRKTDRKLKKFKSQKEEINYLRSFSSKEFDCDLPRKHVQGINNIANNIGVTNTNEQEFSRFEVGAGRKSDNEDNSNESDDDAELDNEEAEVNNNEDNRGANYNDEEINVDHLVENVKNTKPLVPKTNPRRPYPALVPGSMEVHAANKSNQSNTNQSNTNQSNTNQSNLPSGTLRNKNVVPSGKKLPNNNNTNIKNTNASTAKALKPNPRRPNPPLVPSDIEIHNHQRSSISNHSQEDEVSEIVIDERGYIVPPPISLQS